jgi:hypothetical protein
MKNCNIVNRYRYKSAFGASHLRFIVMNNLFATINPLHHRYDIKVGPPLAPHHPALSCALQGSSLGRASSQAERAKGHKCVKKVAFFAQNRLKEAELPPRISI